MVLVNQAEIKALVQKTGAGRIVNKMRINLHAGNKLCATVAIRAKLSAVDEFRKFRSFVFLHSLLQMPFNPRVR
jgi:hypothetical protein